MPRHQPGEAFLKGPLHWDWWSAACRLGGSALHVASHLKQRDGWRGKLVDRFTAPELAELGLSPQTARRGLKLLETAGLVAVERSPGCKLAVRLAVPDAMVRGRSEDRPARWPLKLPIPWGWWTIAARAPGAALHVALAVWFQAGWERNRATFALDSSAWNEMDLTRRTVNRSLEALEGAALLHIERQRSLPPIVSVLEHAGLEAMPSTAAACEYASGGPWGSPDAGVPLSQPGRPCLREKGPR
jgi:DNA-binding transcriptional ArsR family regulator